MEKLWTALWNKLSGDATLISMTGYTTTTKSIKRSNTTTNILFSTTVTKAVTFNEWTDVRADRSSTSPIRDVTFLLVCWSKKNDLECVQLKDYLITLLDGADISDASVLNYHSEYDDFASPPYYDKEELAWRIDVRFRFKCALK